MDKKIRNILVPLDGSKNSIRSLDMAIHLARQCHASITALYVKPEPGIYALHPFGFLDFDSLSNAKKFLNSAKVRAAKHGINLKAKAIGGQPGYDITRFANNTKNKIDIVVIGARGRSPAKELFLGSTSNYVLHKTKKPVMIVRESKTMINKIKKILVPLDGSANSFRGLDEAIYIARQSQGTITGLYVIPLVPPLADSFITPLEKNFLEDAAKFMSKAKTRCAKQGIIFKDRIAYGDDGNVAVKFAQRNDFDVIIIGSRGRSRARELFLGSTSDYIIHKSLKPVILVK